MTTPWTPEQDAALCKVCDVLLDLITNEHHRVRQVIKEGDEGLSKLITEEVTDLHIALTALIKLLIERGILATEDAERLPALQRELAAGFAVDQALTSQETEPTEPDGA
jgi:hypothetical protein